MRFVLLVVFLMGLSGGALSLTAADVVNDAEAQFNLGAMFQDGQGVRLAAEQGHALGQTVLGLMHATGTGVMQNNLYAYMWWNIAASSGEPDAVKNRDIVVKRMTPADFYAAQKLALECVRKKYKGC